MPLVVVDTITAPACWACALVNGDTSALDERDVAALRAWEDDLAAKGWRVVDVVRDDDGQGIEPWFGPWSPRWGARAGDLVDYVIHRDGGVP